MKKNKLNFKFFFGFFLIFLFYKVIYTQIPSITTQEIEKPPFTADYYFVLDEDKYLSKLLENSTVKEIFHNIKLAKEDVIVFSKQGKNIFSFLLNLFLVINLFLGGVLTLVEGAKIWKISSKKRRVLFLIAIFLTLSSALCFYFKIENERFFKENRQQYTRLSIEFDQQIRIFIFSFRKIDLEYNSLEIEHREKKEKEFVERIQLIAGSTFDNLDKLRLEYNAKYGLNSNP